MSGIQIQAKGGRGGGLNLNKFLWQWPVGKNILPDNNNLGIIN